MNKGNSKNRRHISITVPTHMFSAFCQLAIELHTSRNRLGAEAIAMLIARYRDLPEDHPDLARLNARVSPPVEHLDHIRIEHRLAAVERHIAQANRSALDRLATGDILAEFAQVQRPPRSFTAPMKAAAERHQLSRTSNAFVDTATGTGLGKRR